MTKKAPLFEQLDLQDTNGQRENNHIHMNAQNRQVEHYLKTQLGESNKIYPSQTGVAKKIQVVPSKEIAWREPYSKGEAWTELKEIPSKEAAHKELYEVPSNWVAHKEPQKVPSKGIAWAEPQETPLEGIAWKEPQETPLKGIAQKDLYEIPQKLFEGATPEEL